MSHPIGFNMKATTVARRERRPGGGPEQSEGIAVSPKELERGAFYATRSRRAATLCGARPVRWLDEPVSHQIGVATNRDGTV